MVDISPYVKVALRHQI